MERRLYATAEMRVDGDEDAPVIEGHAAVFNQWSELLYGFFREMLLPGAFANVLGDDVRGLKNHDPNFVLGRTRAGTLDLAEDSTGLFFRVRPSGKQMWVRDLRDSMQRGDITQCSFAFDVDVAKWYSIQEGDELEERREIEKFSRLYDVSVVTYPAYPGASATVRSVDELDRHLRDGSVCVDNETLARLMARFSGDTVDSGSQLRARLDYLDRMTRLAEIEAA